MARKSGCNFVLDLDFLEPSELFLRIAGRAGYPYENLYLSGGDYQLVCTIKAAQVDKVKEAVNRLGTPFYQIGCVEEGEGKALVKEKDRFYFINDLSSERFRQHSMFANGYKEYLHLIKTSDIRGERYR